MRMRTVQSVVIEVSHICLHNGRGPTQHYAAHKKKSWMLSFFCSERNIWVANLHIMATCCPLTCTSTSTPFYPRKWGREWVQTKFHVYMESKLLKKIITKEEGPFCNNPTIKEIKHWTI